MQIVTIMEKKKGGGGGGGGGGGSGVYIEEDIVILEAHLQLLIQAMQPAVCHPGVAMQHDR